MCDLCKKQYDFPNSPIQNFDIKVISVHDERLVTPSINFRIHVSIRSLNLLRKSAPKIHFDSNKRSMWRTEFNVNILIAYARISVLLAAYNLKLLTCDFSYFAEFKLMCAPKSIKNLVLLSHTNNSNLWAIMVRMSCLLAAIQMLQEFGNNDHYGIVKGTWLLVTIQIPNTFGARNHFKKTSTPLDYLILLNL